MNDLPVCIRHKCTSVLREDEWGRLLCFRCEDQASQHLSAIPNLYAQLGHHLQRGSGSGGPAVSGSKTAPAPVNEHILELQMETGPILAPLQAWVRDWESYGRAELYETGPLQERVAGACRTLRFNLRWAAEKHPAIDEAVYEFATMHRTLVSATGGERGPHKIPVGCPCGNVIWTTLNTHGEICSACNTEYGDMEVLNLAYVGRRAAA
ncbi:hypothetical protein [Streptomyces sp. NPDC096030]|uniref:hypothetical protein n=1 Tax=Streptomyces sp. NPDC096030 TaxID=3155423 RepID=UPI003323B41F